MRSAIPLAGHRLFRRLWSLLSNPLLPYACAILFVLAITIGVV